MTQHNDDHSTEEADKGRVETNRFVPKPTLEIGQRPSPGAGQRPVEGIGQRPLPGAGYAAEELRRTPVTRPTRSMDADEGEESDADRVSANRERRSDAPAVVPTIHNAGKPLQGGSRRSMDADEGEESDDEHSERMEASSAKRKGAR